MLKVTKRSGREVPVNYHKITQRLAKLASEEPALDNDFVDPSKVAQSVIGGLYDKVSTEEIDNLAAEIAGSMIIQHPEYGKLASRILISNLHKSTPNCFTEAMVILFNNVNPKTKEKAPLVSDEIIELAIEFEDEIDELLNDCKKDYLFSYMGMRTLMKSYLIKSDDKIIERPQYMIMRVALGIWKNNWEEVVNTYNNMSNKLFTHATPTLFNAGTLKPQLSSCFLIQNKEDSLDGIMSTKWDVAKISSLAGGIGLSIHDIRANGSYIKGSGGTSKGILPLLKTYNEEARYWDQGGNKRKGSFAMYLEPWHADIETLIDIRKNTGAEELRARDLFPAMWVPDLFMQRVAEDGEWTLMCPNECPGLSDVYGEEFETLYTKYEIEGKGRKTIKAQDLYSKITTAQLETGTPYMVYKDASNRKSNQKNLGTIKSSNLCTEILEYTAPDEQAVCNLGSIAVNMFINEKKNIYDFDKLWQTAYQLTKNLNQVIEVNMYPTKETKKSNMRNRPIGIGIQGLADTFAMLKQDFDSEESFKLNEDIFETIYHAALTSSMHMSKDFGPYETFKGSPTSKGILQFDMWDKGDVIRNKGRYNWNSLSEEIKKFGIRNSLLMAPMPTASTAQILGNNECFEPFTSNLYTRRILAGEYIMINEHMVKDFIEEDIWDKELINNLMANNGSVQNIERVPQYLKNRYKTVWEMSMKTIIEMAADRGKFICQSQSMNLFLEDASVNAIRSMHMYSWKLGLKTGMYYLRTKAAKDAVKFTVTKNSLKAKTEEERLKEEIEACSLENPDSCDMCSG